MASERDLIDAGDDDASLAGRAGSLSGRSRDLAGDFGVELDPDLHMGIVLNLVALLRDSGAAVTTNNLRALAAACTRLVDLPLATSTRQLAQLALLGLLSPVQSAQGDTWEPTDNDFAALLREEAAPRLEHALGLLRVRAGRLARHGRARPQLAPPGEDALPATAT